MEITNEEKAKIIAEYIYKSSATCKKYFRQWPDETSCEGCPLKDGKGTLCYDEPMFDYVRFEEDHSYTYHKDLIKDIASDVVRILEAKE